MTTLFTTNIISLLNGPILPAAIAAGGIVYFARNYYKANKLANKNRKEIQQNIINSATIAFPQREYNVACAGSKEGDTCKTVSAIDIQSCNFCDANGTPLNLSLYDCFVVHGESMKYAGIKNNDFILVAKDFTLSSLNTFPEILVIRYRVQDDNKPSYKVRRTWYKGSIDDDLQEVAKGIFDIPAFQTLTKQVGFRSKEWMIDDLTNKRLKKYKDTYNTKECNKEIIISTTFDTENKEIHFSIHPVSLIVGVVKEAYTIKQNI